MKKKNVLEEIEGIETKKESVIDTVSRELKDKYKTDVLIDASQIKNRPRQVIPFSPALDIQLNGGVPEGILILISGKEKSGKTTSILQLIRNAQKPEYGTREAFYIDVESRLEKMQLECVEGLDLNKLHIIRSTKEKIYTAQEYIEMVRHLCKKLENSIIVLDSSSAMCSESEMYDEITGQSRSLIPKMLSTLCKNIAGFLPVKKNILIIVQHLIANTSGYGTAMMEDSGNKIRYQCSVKMRIVGNEPIVNKDTGKQIGQSIKWKIIYSALGTPNGEAISTLKYGKGLDDVAELIGLGKELGFIVQGGPFYTCKFIEDEPKFKGMDALYEHLSSNSDLVKDLRNKVFEMLS